jgi:hypothetical protein
VYFYLRFKINQSKAFGRIKIYLPIYFQQSVKKQQPTPSGTGTGGAGFTPFSRQPALLSSSSHKDLGFFGASLDRKQKTVAFGLTTDIAATVLVCVSSVRDHRPSYRIPNIVFSIIFWPIYNKILKNIYFFTWN